MQTRSNQPKKVIGFDSLWFWASMLDKEAISEVISFITTFQY